MPFLKEIVDYINTTLKDGALSTSSFKVAQHGIAQLVPVNDEDAQNSLPLLVSHYGSGEFVGIDQRYSIITYHRCLEKTYTNSTENFGRGNADKIENNRMRLVVYADRAALKRTPEQIADIIVAGLPGVLPRTFYTNKTGLNGAEVIPVLTEMDALTVWGNEYQGYPYKMPMESCLIAIEYTAQVRFNASCIEDCITC